MALARLNRPSIMIYGGSILPGRFRGRDVTIQDVFEVSELSRLARCPMKIFWSWKPVPARGGRLRRAVHREHDAMAFEFLGISPLNGNSVPAVDPQKDLVGYQAGQLVMELIKKNITPKQILTRDAFLNAITAVVASGGSTNAVLHLLACAHEAG